MASVKKKTPVTKKNPKTVKTSSSKAGPKKVDWYEARKVYLSDNTISYSDIAKKFGVSKKAVTDIASKESWPSLRQDLSEKAFNEFTQKLLDTKSEAQARHLQHFQNLQGLANRSIMEMAETNFFRDKRGNLVTIKDKDGKERPIPRPINPFELEKLAKALKDAINGERVVLGLPTSVSALTDPEGGNVWSGFSDMIKAAERVLAENGQSESGGNSET